MLRIFLVEDEGAVREGLRDMVPWNQYGYALAGEAGDGEMALPLIRQAKPDVLITDIRMPFMDGLALSELVRREFPEMRIIVISGCDDFACARRAIDIGVDRYFLKPVSRGALLLALEEIREKIEGERASRGPADRSRREAQAYEQYARRAFFEEIAAGRMTVQQIYETAAGLDIDLRAQRYAIAFFSAPPERSGAGEPLLEHFLKYPEYLLLRWSMDAYAVLLKGAAGGMEELSRRCVEAVRDRYGSCAPEGDWYVAVSRPTQRLSTLPDCFEEVSRLWAYRYVMPRQHVLTADTVSPLTGAGGEKCLDRLDADRADPAILEGAMGSVSAQEVPRFVEEYVDSVAEALPSRAFCQYLMLSARFAAVRFAAGLGVSQQETLAPLTCLDMVGRNITAADLRDYLSAILLRVLELRDREAGGQRRGPLGQALAYIDSHFTDGSLSLVQVARAVNISANYLSALFSQEVGETFTEYVTRRRMELAKELLQATDKRSGEVAAAVGYRDPHYFSFLFKKTQGCTPRDYRSGGKRG